MAEDWELFGNDYEDAEAGKSSANPSDEAGKKTSVRETEQEIEKKSLEGAGYGASGI